MKLILNNGRNNHGRRLVELIETSKKNYTLHWLDQLRTS